MANPDLTISLKKVNRGENLRWVGSRCPLTRALGERYVRSILLQQHEMTPASEEMVVASVLAMHRKSGE